MAMIGDDEQPSLLLEDTREPGARRLPPATYTNIPMPTSTNTSTILPTYSPDRSPTLNRKRRKVPSPLLKDTIESRARHMPRESSSYLDPLSPEQNWKRQQMK